MASSLQSHTQETIVAISMTTIISTTLVIEKKIKTLTNVEKKFATMDPAQKFIYFHLTGTIRLALMSAERILGMISAMTESALIALYIADSIAELAMYTTKRSTTLTMR